MDYSNSGAVKLMEPIAKRVGPTHVPFNQMQLISSVETMTGGDLAEGHRGICYGLSVAWLEAMHQNSNSSAFVDEVSDVNKSGLFYRSYMAYRHQDTYKHLNSGTMTGKNFSAKDKFFDIGAIEQNNILKATGNSRSFGGSHGELKNLTQFLCSNGSKRYFMLHIPGHAMAGVGSKRGHCSFFDPNFGIVYSMFADRVARCFFDFVSNAKVKAVYSPAPANWLTATEFM